MRQLYKLSLEITSLEPGKVAEIKSIAMMYSQTRDSVSRCHTEWFYRELRNAQDARMKRTQNEDHRDRREIQSKKLKVRNKNKVGMDSLLGAFM